ncbi:unnamed protein product [Euphydryas editha]|uniref:Uncharacterized protein n=1 Tax=Euphydryas editha TaxID=104508 RepID=A0AAU9TIH9_EUPED|nr:unnamed protein product [Euphydryas editha]
MQSETETGKGCTVFHFPENHPESEFTIVLCEEHLTSLTPRKMKQCREEILRRKREMERKRYARIKNDPLKKEEMKLKSHEKYLRKKQKGTRKLVKDMTLQEHQEAKKKWKEHCCNYRNKKKREA